MLKINKDTNIMYFDNDDEFYQFCVAPVVIPIASTKDGITSYSFDFDFTQGYKNALSNGKRFVIKDEDSQIYKRGAVTYRTITKPIQNLDQYFNHGD